MATVKEDANRLTATFLFLFAPARWRINGRSSIFFDVKEAIKTLRWISESPIATTRNEVLSICSEDSLYSKVEAGDNFLKSIEFRTALLYPRKPRWFTLRFWAEEQTDK